ncbi:MAG: HD domain-containing protein [Desulfosalsimonadaceae bacterium]
MKNTFINELKAGQAVDDSFVLAGKNLSQKKDGGYYMTVSLSDKTGTIRGVVWDNIDDLRELADAGDFIRVRGTVSEYRGALQIVVKSLERQAAGELRATDFMPTTTRDPEAMLKKLIGISRTVENPHLQSLMQAFWADADFVENLKIAPAAKHMHHAYLGGLLEHTLSVALLAERLAEHYSGIDRDLLLTGAILHDIGKIREFVYDRRIDYSDEGRLINHIGIGLEMVQGKIAGLGDFPPQTARLIKHMLVSHHGNREFGSPEPPKILEAVMLHYLDEIDSKVNGIREFMEKQDLRQGWTGYHKPLERFFFKASAGEAEPEKE